MNDKQRFLYLLRTKAPDKVALGVLGALALGNVLSSNHSFEQQLIFAGEGAIAGFLWFLFGFAKLLDRLERAGIR